MEPNSGENWAVMDRQKIPNEEVAILSLTACQEEMMVCRETMRARLECEEPSSVDMESEALHEEFCMEDAAVKSLGTMKKQHRGRYLVAGRHGEPKKLTQVVCGSWRKLTAACRKVSRCARVSWCKRNIVRNK
jgi:hypothetical protein